MESFAFGIGVLLAVLGPLLLIPVVWLVYRVVTRPIIYSAFVPRVSKGTGRWIALISSVLVVTGAISVSYFPGRWEFDRLCSEHATPIVSDRVRTSSFYRSRLYPHEARQFLEDNAFAFVEAPHMYKKGIYVRYSKTDDGAIREEEVPTLKSSYGVQENFSQLSSGLLMTEKVVYDMNTDRKLARAAHIVYEGGPLSLFLGVYAMSSCPDVRSADGSRHFETFYNLETLVLRAARQGS